MDDNEIQYSEFLAAMMASRIALHDELLKDAFRTGHSGCLGIGTTVCYVFAFGRVGFVPAGVSTLRARATFAEKIFSRF